MKENIALTTVSSACAEGATDGNISIAPHPSIGTYSGSPWIPSEFLVFILGYSITHVPRQVQLS